MTRKALLLGATGLVGRDCLENLLASDDYERVCVLTRRPLSVKHPKLDVHEVDFDNIEACQSQFQVDDVFCCLGSTMKKPVPGRRFVMWITTWWYWRATWPVVLACNVFWWFRR